MLNGSLALTLDQRTCTRTQSHFSPLFYSRPDVSSVKKEILGMRGDGGMATTLDVSEDWQFKLL